MATDFGSKFPAHGKSSGQMKRMNEIKKHLAKKDTESPSEEREDKRLGLTEKMEAKMRKRGR